MQLWWLVIFCLYWPFCNGNSKPVKDWLDGMGLYSSLTLLAKGGVALRTFWNYERVGSRKEWKITWKPEMWASDILYEKPVNQKCFFWDLNSRCEKAKPDENCCHYSFPAAIFYSCCHCCLFWFCHLALKVVFQKLNLKIAFSSTNLFSLVFSKLV